MSLLQTLGVASCLGGSRRFCGNAAELLRDEFASQTEHRLQNQWHMLYPKNHGTKEEKLAQLNKSISQFTEYWVQENRHFLIVGGDHSCAMGTWGGVLNGLKQPDKFGLLWLDAHMDAHTYVTSPSGNVHGMPVAALLGKADPKLAKLYPSSNAIKPENLILIGVRSYEDEEYALLKQAGVEVFFTHLINELSQVLLKALDKLDHSCNTIGISIDLDVIDPEDAPGVETPVQNGISAEELLTALSLLNRHPKVCGLEISEYNPENDRENKTLHLMKSIIETFYAEAELPACA